MIVINYPTGSIVSYAGSSSYSIDFKNSYGWVPCDGSFYDGNNKEYEGLWNLIGTTFGGTGKGSFRVPDLGKRVPRGVTATASGTGVNGAISSWTGAERVTLSASESGMASHTHSLNDPGHKHSMTASTSHQHTFYYQTITTYGAGGDKYVGLTAYPFNNGGDGTYYTTFTSETPTVTVGNTSISSNMGALSSSEQSALASHINIQPTVYLHYFIKL